MKILRAAFFFSIFPLFFMRMAACQASELPEACDWEVIEVNTRLDENDGSCDLEHCSLREAVIVSNLCPGEQTIELVSTNTYYDPDTSYELTLDEMDGGDIAKGGDLDIGDDLVIRGDGAWMSVAVIENKIDGERVFEIFSPAEVRFETLKITDGSADYGAGILNHSKLTMVDCYIHSNHTPLDISNEDHRGGGIYNDENSTLELIDVEMFFNSAVCQS